MTRQEKGRAHRVCAWRHFDRSKNSDMAHIVTENITTVMYTRLILVGFLGGIFVSQWERARSSIEPSETSRVLFAEIMLPSRCRSVMYSRGCTICVHHEEWLIQRNPHEFTRMWLGKLNNDLSMATTEDSDLIYNI